MFLAFVLELVWLGLTLGGAVDVAFFALPLAVFAGLGLPLLGSGSSTRRTAAGRELWSQVGGFRRMLSTASADARFDFAGKQDLYTAYLPWAVAFGCADRWAEKYQLETGQPPPLPAYLGDSGVSNAGSPDQLAPAAAFATMVDDFDTTVGKAISAYSASQVSSSSSSSSSSSDSSSSSSSSSSGGGGGGGGGGGSW